MKQLVQVQEVEGDGFIGLLGSRATFFCGVYIYTGLVVGVNDSFIKLQDAKIVYETGELLTKAWKDAQSLPSDWYVTIQSVESFGILK